jgi:hypothetical protein
MPYRHRLLILDLGSTRGFKFKATVYSPKRASVPVVLEAGLAPGRVRTGVKKEYLLMPLGIKLRTVQTGMSHIGDQEILSPFETRNFIIVILKLTFGRYPEPVHTVSHAMFNGSSIFVITSL